MTKIPHKIEFKRENEIDSYTVMNDRQRATDRQTESDSSVVKRKEEKN